MLSAPIKLPLARFYLFSLFCASTSTGQQHDPSPTACARTHDNQHAPPFQANFFAAKCGNSPLLQDVVRPLGIAACLPPSPPAHADSVVSCCSISAPLLPVTSSPQCPNTGATQWRQQWWRCVAGHRRLLTRSVRCAGNPPLSIVVVHS